MARRNKAVKKKRKMTGFGLLVVFTLLLCGFVTYGTVQLKKDRDEKLVRQQELQIKIAEQQQESDKLDIKKDYTKTKKFVEEMARKVLGLVYPDEILFEENPDKN